MRTQTNFQERINSNDADRNFLTADVNRQRAKSVINYKP